MSIFLSKVYSLLESYPTKIHLNHPHKTGLANMWREAVHSRPISIFSQAISATFQAKSSPKDYKYSLLTHNFKVPICLSMSGKTQILKKLF